MSYGRRPGPTGQIDIPSIPGADNRWFASQGQARNAALRAANQWGLGHTIVHDPRPMRGLPHYHIVSPTGQRVSGHYFYGRRLPRRFFRGRPWREFEVELAQTGPVPKSEFMARRSPSSAEIAARNRGAELVGYWVGNLDKSNKSGTPVRSRAQIRAGNQLIQEANQMSKSNPLQEAYRRHGHFLMRKGRQGLHKSQSGRLGRMREFEFMLEDAAEAMASPRRPRSRRLRGDGNRGRLQIFSRLPPANDNGQPPHPALAQLRRIQNLIRTALIEPLQGRRETQIAIEQINQMTSRGGGPWAGSATIASINLREALRSIEAGNARGAIADLQKAFNRIAAAIQQLS